MGETPYGSHVGSLADLENRSPPVYAPETHNTSIDSDAPSSKHRYGAQSGYALSPKGHPIFV